MNKRDLISLVKQAFMEGMELGEGRDDEYLFTDRQRYSFAQCWRLSESRSWLRLALRIHDVPDADVPRELVEDK